MQTRQRSVLDLVITDSAEAIDNIQLRGTFADSDHSMLSWIINFEDANHVYKQQGHTVSYDYAKRNYAAMQEELSVSSMRWEDLLQPLGLTVEDCWKTFKDVINRLEAKYIPLKNHSRNKMHKPIWMTYKAMKLVRRKHKTYMKYENVNAYVKVPSVPAHRLELTPTKPTKQ